MSCYCSIIMTLYDDIIAFLRLHRYVEVPQHSDDGSILFELIITAPNSFYQLKTVYVTVHTSTFDGIGRETVLCDTEVGKKASQETVDMVFESHKKFYNNLSEFRSDHIRYQQYDIDRATVAVGANSYYAPSHDVRHSGLIPNTGMGQTRTMRSFPRNDTSFSDNPPFSMMMLRRHL